jgi:hypothetical protein
MPQKTGTKKFKALEFQQLSFSLSDPKGNSAKSTIGARKINSINPASGYRYFKGGKSMDKAINDSAIVKRTNRFMERYGMKSKYLAQRVHISPSYFSQFLNGRSFLYEPQYDRLTNFLNEWDRRMVGFDALEN